MNTTTENTNIENTVLNNCNLVLNQTKEFKELFKSVNSILEEINIKINEYGMNIKGLNNGHTTFVNLLFDPYSFDEFKVNGEINVIIQSQEVKKILTRLKNDDYIFIRSDGQNLDFIFEGSSRNKFSLEVIQNLEPDLKTPQIEFGKDFEIPTNELIQMIKNIELFNDEIKFKVNNTYFIGSDVENKKTECKYIHGEKIDDEYTSIYSIEHLKNILKSDKFAKYVNLSFKTNQALRLIMVNSAEDIQISYLLAPRYYPDIV
jgi:DNA polymerase III sliding clamp (beta) subunit (PCNA family)